MFKLRIAFVFLVGLAFVESKAAPVHRLEGEALELAESNGFLSDDYDRLHLVELSEHLGDSLHSLDLQRIRKRRGTQEDTKLHVPINGKNYKISLKHPRSLLHKNAQIIVANGEDSEENHQLPPRRDCHLVGDVDGHQGSASLSYCDRLRGSLIVGDVEYILEPLEDGQHLVAERKKPDEWPYEQYEDLTRRRSDYLSETESEEPSLPDETNDVNGFQSRSIPATFYAELKSKSPRAEELTSSGGNKPVVIELAVYCDADYTALMNRAKADTVQKKVDYIISKFNGVQYEYAKAKQLQRVVIFQLKKIVFFKTNPKWLVVKNSLYPMLYSLCAWNKNKAPYDIVYMITGKVPMRPIGLGWVGGTCSSRYRCGISIGTAWGRYAAIVHEIGHLLGMKHDYSTKCKSLPHGELGIMGGRGTNFSKCSADDFDKNLKQPRHKCLFRQDIPDDDVMPELKGVRLGNIPNVVNVTHHQYCEKLMGLGYRYREREYRKYSCDRGYYCVQLKDGPDFGLIYREPAQGIVGMYCAPGKVCWKRSCVTYTSMTLHAPWVVRAGGWGDWSEWTTCSRSCGTGVKYSHRECDNPTPIQSKYCEGNEYRAELCNTEPCAGDSSDTNSLIKSRADETCKRLVEANALKPDYKYEKTGRVYGSRGYDNVCDTHCDNKKDRNSRDAILPDGTPCSSPAPESEVGTRKNVQTRCFRGKCQAFGCDGKFPAKLFGSNPGCK